MALMDFRQERLVEVRAGRLLVRMAETVEEVYAAQGLRYRVFYEEMAARPTAEMAAAGRDFDSFDDFCDHLLVFDCDRVDGPEGVIGTYRVMRREGAAERGRFYSADEYEIDNLLTIPGEILELGRSCIDAAYRNGTTMQLLWRGIAEYVRYYDIEVMFGCASLPGTDLEELAPALAYLYRHHLAPPALRPRARPERRVAMDRIPENDIAPRRALQILPPLIKGYLRAGGFVGDGAVIDHDFGTTDVCVVVKTEWVTDRYHRHYAREVPDSNQVPGPKKDHS